MREVFPVDTSFKETLLPFPAIEWMSDEMVVALRAMTVTQKLQLVGKINLEVRRRVAASIRLQNPHWVEEEVHAEFLRTMQTATYESLTEFMPANILEL